MESLSIGLSSSSAFQNHHKLPTSKPKSFTFLPKSICTCNNSFDCDQTPKKIPHPPQKTQPLIRKLNTTRTTQYYPKILHNNFAILRNHSFLPQDYLKSHLSFLYAGVGLVLFSFPHCCFASDNDIAAAAELQVQAVVSNKINLEAVLVSIDDFFNRNPFFVAGVTFIWLVVIPLTQEFLQKYKFISAIDAFRKLRDDPHSQLLDIRDKKTLQQFLGSPNLKILNKGVVHVEFRQGDEQGFLNKVLDKFAADPNLDSPENSIICVLDNFDGNSLKVAELLFKNGFKEAYAIRGGVRGKNGWQSIQETLLPPSVHIYPKKRDKMLQRLQMNGGANQQSYNLATSSTISTGQSERVENGYLNNAIESTQHVKKVSRSLSPYPNYPDMKPPSSPTPSKP